MSLEPRPLTTRSLNRALLARQLLLQRSSLPLPALVDRMGGIQSQYAPSSYIGVWSRGSGFMRHQLTRALESRRLVQGSLMRVTIHIVSRNDYPLLASAIRRSRREWWIRIARQRGLDTVDCEEAAGLIRSALRSGPMKADDLIAVLLGAGHPKEVWEGVGLWVDLVRVPPSGTWDRRRADLYGLADTWIDVPKSTEQEAMKHLVRRYLSAFGPAAIGDASRWSGIPGTALREALEHVGTRRFVTESGEELFDVPRAPLPSPDRPAPVRFLPTWDAVLLAHARRTQVLPEEYRPLVFHTKNPQSLPTFLVDGQVAGSWRHEGGKIRLEPFHPLPRTTRQELEEEAAGLAAFHS